MLLKHTNIFYHNTRHPSAHSGMDRNTSRHPRPTPRTPRRTHAPRNRRRPHRVLRRDVAANEREPGTGTADRAVRLPCGSRDRALEAVEHARTGVSDLAARGLAPNDGDLVRHSRARDPGHDRSNAARRNQAPPMIPIAPIERQMQRSGQSHTHPRSSS